MRNIKHNISDPIPYDLLVDIFSRVPANSIARFRCVSKSCASILRRQDFTELFLTRSSTRLLLLFIFQANGKFFFYSSPQLQNPDENSSLVATCYKNYPPGEFSSTICFPALRGLVCLQNWGGGDTVRVICNPVTGESITLPTMETKSTIGGGCYLGYDPIDKQFKVLCMTWSKFGVFNTYEHRILTLETGKRMLWRMIKCKPHCPSRDMICINGVLYYRADFEGSHDVIVCFDVRLEEFSFIDNIDVKMVPSHWTLINYKGKLGVLQYNWLQNELVLWVLEDVGEGILVSNVCALPPLWENNKFYFVGMTSIGEIIVSPYYLSDPFYVFYYNPEKNTFKKINIQGFNIQRFEVSKYHQIHTFSDYIEDVKAM